MLFKFYCILTECRKCHKTIQNFKFVHFSLYTASYHFVLFLNDYFAFVVYKCFFGLWDCILFLCKGPPWTGLSLLCFCCKLIIHLFKNNFLLFSPQSKKISLNIYRLRLGLYVERFSLCWDAVMHHGINIAYIKKFIA